MAPIPIFSLRGILQAGTVCPLTISPRWFLRGDYHGVIQPRIPNRNQHFPNLQCGIRAVSRQANELRSRIRPRAGRTPVVADVPADAIRNGWVSIPLVGCIFAGCHTRGWGERGCCPAWRRGLPGRCNRRSDGGRGHPHAERGSRQLFPGVGALEPHDAQFHSHPIFT